MDFSAEQSPTATDKIQLENITSASAMDRHRRTNCAVEPSLNSGKNSSRNKRVVTSPPSGRSETFDQTLQSFRDTDAAKRFFKRRMKLLSSAACIMGLLSACLALADIELTIMGTDTDEKLSLKNLRAILDNPYRLAAVVVKSTLSIISVLTCVMIYHMYKNDLSYLVVRNIYHESEKFFMTSLFPSCLLEALVCLFHVPPLFDYYGLLYKLQLLVFLRLYLVAKYVKEHNMFVNNQATALFASVTQTDISSMFLVKAYFLKYPVRLISIFYALNVFLGGYVVYVIDRPHTSYLDTVWMLVVTMTTLGFGDVVPKAFLARAFVGLASVLGIFLMALFISVVHETLQLKQQEKRILAIMENAEHLSGKKNLAASCIQSSWRLYHFRITNEDALMRGDWFKYQKLVIIHHRMAEYLRHWRIARRSWSRDDYWKKFFLADDIAMLLTDVSRSVGNVELFLEKQNSGRRSSSRSSLRRGSVTSPPPILEEETASLLPGSPPKDKTRKVHAKLVESWSTSNQEQTPRPSIPKSPVLPPTRPSSGHLLQLTYNHLDKSKPGQMNHFQYDKFNRLGDDGRNGVSPGPRKDEPADRGGIPVDGLHGKVESLEKALDHIYFKMKTELRDVRDSLKLINRRPMSAAASPGLGAKTTGVDFYSYSRTTDQINV